MYFKTIFKAPSAYGRGEVVLGKSPNSGVYIVVYGDGDDQEIYLDEGGPVETDLRLLGVFSAETALETDQELEEALVVDQKEYFEFSLYGNFTPGPDFDGGQRFEVTAKGNTLAR